MTNDTNVMGLKPYGKVLHVGIYRASLSAPLYKYMPVMLNSAGMIQCGTGGAVDLGRYIGSLANILGTGSDHDGLPTALTSLSQAPYMNAASDSYCLVYDDPEQLFVLEEDTGGTALTSIANGQSCSWTFQATTGNTNTGIANAVLDRSDIASDTGGNLVVLYPAENSNSDGSPNTPGSYCKWVVQILRHQRGEGLRGYGRGHE